MVPTGTFAAVEERDTPTATGAAVSVIVVAADFVPSATDVAVIVTVAGVGGALGALNVTVAPDALAVGETDPHAAPLQPAPVTVQLTP